MLPSNVVLFQTAVVQLLNVLLKLLTVLLECLNFITEIILHLMWWENGMWVGDMKQECYNFSEILVPQVILYLFIIIWIIILT